MPRATWRIRGRLAVEEGGDERLNSTPYSPPLDDGDDVIDLNVQLVDLVKVLQSAHVRGHRLRVTQNKPKEKKKSLKKTTS